MDVNPQQIVKMIRDLLGNPGTEQSIRSQMLELAKKNLHLSGVVEAVVDAVQQLKDSETRKQGWQFIMSLEDSRFKDVTGLYTKLIEVLSQEKDRGFRSTLLSRLTRGLHLNPKIAPMLINLMIDPQVNEDERTQVMQALSKLPLINEEMAVAALDKAHASSMNMQIWAIELAVGVANWSEDLVAKLTPYLQPQMPVAVREKVWALLTEGRRVGPALTPLLVNVLRLEASAKMRAQALETLSKIKTDNGDVFAQLVWTAQNDQDQTLRVRATELQRQHPQITEAQVRKVAERLFQEPTATGREALLTAVKPWVRDAEVRKTLANAFATTQLSSIPDDEFNAMVELLFPYVTRETDIRDALMKAATNEPAIHRRRSLIDKLIQTLKVDTILPWVSDLFRRERDLGLREILFEKLFALSINKHAELVKVFSEEVREPSSPFRVRTAMVLAPVIELHPEIVAAFEDVMLHDQDRELVRVATEGYVKPGIEPKFIVLLEVARNEALEISTRKTAIHKLSQMALTETQQTELSEALKASPTKF